VAASDLRDAATRPSYDAVVIGAGPNGLSAAIALARSGLSVLVVESKSTIGGGARSAELTLPGFTSDVCSAIHPTALVSPFFRALPLAEHGVEWVHPDAPLAHPLPDGSAAIMERDLALANPSLGDDAQAWRDLFEPLSSRADALFLDLLAPAGLPSSPVLMTRFGVGAMRSAVGLARAKFRGEHARALFAGCAAHSFLPLERSFTAAFGLVLASAGHAVGWPCARRGSQSVVDALAAILRSLGGEIVVGHRVSSLGELPESRAVLFDTTPRAMSSIAGDALPASYRRKLERFRHGPGSFKVDWALDGPIPWRASGVERAATVHVCGTLDEVAESERAAWSDTPAERPFVLVAQQSLFDATRAPAGKHVGWAYCHVPAGCAIDMTDRIEAQIERFAPGFRDRILARAVMSPQAFERHNENYVGGDIAGGSNELGQLFARPVSMSSPYATPNRALYLCSASTPPGGGVHGMCGFFAAQLAGKRVFGKRLTLVE
jgi:phytoene dehydrogenase-like protein